MLVQPPPGPLSGPSPVRNRRRNPLWRFRRVLFVVSIFAWVMLGAVWAFASKVERIEDNFEDLIETTYICTGEVTTACGPDNAANELAAAGEARVVVDYAEIPPVVIQAVIATEDQSFFEHRGVDPGGLLRAAYQVAKRELTDGTGSLQGGSTITQQYIKLATQDDEDDLGRKGREIVRAIKLEQELTDELGSTEAAKRLILERYLNRAYFGRGVYGVQAASRVYFDKDVADLTLSQAAYLAGLLRSAESADASEDPVEAARRRSTSLELMLEEGYITVEQRLAADEDPWTELIPPPAEVKGLGEVKGSDFGTQYFVRAVRSQLNDLYPNGEYFTESLRVYTTLDPELQRLAYQTITSKLNPGNPYMPNGALAAVDAQGRVVAMMGGADWEVSRVNLATGVGGSGGFEAGSQMKVYALAEFIDQGYSPESYYAAPYTIEFPASDDGQCDLWKVKGGVTDDPTRATHRTVYQATASSTNTVFAQMMFDIGAAQMVDMARSLGIEGEMLPCPSTVLGTNPVTPVEMAGSFGNISREGMRLDPVLIERIEDANGNVLCWYPTESCDEGSSPSRQGEQVLDPAVARQVIGAMQAVVDGGTGRRARLILEDETIRPAAGKTGTTQQNQHAWFSGFTCGLATSVWVGYPGDPTLSPRYMNDAVNVENGLDWPTMAELFGTDEYNNSRGNGSISGGNVPAELWHDFMMGALTALPPCEELPTEGPSSSQTVLGLDLLTTLLHCAEPDPALVAAESTTTVPEETTSTEPGETTETTETTATTEPVETTAVETTAPPDDDGGGDDSNGDEGALGLGTVSVGAGGGSLGARSATYGPVAWMLPLNNQEQPEPTTPPQTAPPSTDPCIPVDLGGNPLETTVPGADGGPDGGSTTAPDGGGGGGEEGAAPATAAPQDEERGRGRGRGRRDRDG